MSFDPRDLGVSDDDLRRMAGVMRAIAKDTVNEALRRARVSTALPAVVEDINEERDVVYVRNDDAVAGADFYQGIAEMPGLVAATRQGNTNANEQVRMFFDGSAGGTATHTGVESRIVLPFGAESGLRIVLDGSTGQIEFYNAADDLVGILTPSVWAIGDVQGEAQRVTLDPVGGLRLRSGNNVLVLDINSQPAIIIRDPNTGVTRGVIRETGYHLIDPETGTDLEITTGGHGIPDPKYGESIVTTNPGTGMPTPTSSTYTGDDLELRHIVAWRGDLSIAAPSFNALANYTERTDIADSTNGRTLHVLTATRHPAVPDAVRTFVNTSSAFRHSFGETIVVRGAGAVSPTWVEKTQAFTEVGNATEVTATLAKPPSTADGSLLIAFVDMGNSGGSIPIGWSIPEGWVPLGANFVLSGSGATQQMLAGGAWYKRAGPAEPADYGITVNFGDTGYKRLSAEINLIANPGTFSSGAGFKMNGRLMPRLLDVIELTSNTSSVVFGGPSGQGQILGTNPIPPDFDNLELECAFKSVGGDSGGADANLRRIFVRFNGDNTSGNYAWRLDGTLGSVDNQSATALIISTLWTNTADFRSSATVSIPDYSRPTERATTVGQFTTRTGGGAPNTLLGRTGGRWTGTNAITSLSVDTEGLVTQFKAGSKFWLYGK